jgi:gamma-glutamyltranspeptidase/glutathione hydrolase
MNQAKYGVVAAGHPLTAEAGLTILQQGGNAFDAAIAASLMACVTESTLTSLAGGGFLLAYTAQGQSKLYDFFSQTPRQQRPASEVDFYPIEADFGDATQEFHIGLGSMAVPGVLAGLFHVHQQLGRLPLSMIMEPAIQVAKTGFVLDEFRAYCIDILKPILLATARSRQIYAPEGTLLKQGDRLYLPDLAQTLDYLAQTGMDGFYRGDIAQQLVRDCQDQGGYLTLEDLSQYRVIERQPLAMTYRDRTLLTNPPPSSGGTLIAFALKLMNQVKFGDMQPGSSEHLTLLAQVMRLTNQARRDGYDAQLYEPDVAQRFLADDHVRQYQPKLEPACNKWGSTTHISVIDRQGNAASVTTSNGEGSSYVIPGTGIMVNNMLGEEDLNPNGFHQWQPNQRISSMMSPTMLLHNGRPEVVLGSGGSNRIRTAILQVLSNLVDFQMPVAAAVTHPRIHWERHRFHLEPGLQLDSAARPLFAEDELIHWTQFNMFFGGVHAVTCEEGDLQGIGDPRRGGAIARH